MKVPKLLNVRILITLPVLLAGSIMMTLGSARSAMASTIPVAIVPCATCQTASSLSSAALSYVQKYDNATPSGYIGVIKDWGPCADVTSTTTGSTVVLVVSTQIAISGAFYACWLYPSGNPGPHYLWTNALRGGSNSDAIAFDNAIMARAELNAGRITLPSSQAFDGEGGSSTPSQWEDLVSSSLVMVVPGSESYGFAWHFVNGMPSIFSEEFVNTGTGTTFRAWEGDTITVYDSNGWSAKFQFIYGVTWDWVLVPNSIRDQNGNPPPGTTSLEGPIGGGVSQPIGALNVTLPAPWGGIPVEIIALYNGTTPDGSIVVGPVEPTPQWETQCAALGVTDTCPQ